MARGPLRSLLVAVAAEMGCSVIAGADAGSAESVHGYGARAVLAHHAPDWPGEAHRLMDSGGGGERRAPGCLRPAPASDCCRVDQDQGPLEGCTGPLCRALRRSGAPARLTLRI